MIRLLTTSLLVLAAWVADAASDAFPPFRVEAARDYLDAVAHALPAQTGTNADCWLIQARLASRLGRQDEAERWARRAWETDSRRADVQVFLADLLIRQDRLDEAAQCLRAALALNPDLGGAYRRLGMVLDRLGDRAAARDAFDSAVRAAPDDATSRLLLGRWLLDHGQPKEAAVQLEQACRLDPESANPRYALSQAQSQLGDRESADRTLAVFRRLKEKEKAALVAADAARDDDREMRAIVAGFHFEAAGLLGQQGRDALAEAHLVQASWIAPSEPRAWELLAAAYLRKQAWAQAKGAYDELVRLRPDQPTYRVSLATVLLQLQNPQAAEAELKGALALDPQQPGALYNLARLYLTHRRELPEALTLCQRLVAADPSAPGYDLLGWASFVNGRTNEALAAAAEAVRKDRSNPGYLERYRKVYQAAGSPTNNPAFLPLP